MAKRSVRKVEYEIPEAEWEESHRTRQWVLASKAAEMVRQEELRPMIISLSQQYSD